MTSKQEDIAHLNSQIDIIEVELNAAQSEMEVFQNRINAGEAVEYNTNQLRTARAGFELLEKMRQQVTNAID